MHVLVLSVALSQLPGTWTPVETPFKPNSQTVSEASVLEFASTTAGLIPITTGHVSGSSGLSAQFANDTLGDTRGVVNALRFRLSDTIAGGKSRIEATSCYATNASLVAHGLDPASLEANMFRRLSFVDQNCSGAFTSRFGATGVIETNVSYLIWLAPTTAGEQLHITRNSLLLTSACTLSVCKLSWVRAWGHVKHQLSSQGNSMAGLIRASS
jgi:hypothetical protein